MRILAINPKKSTFVLQNLHRKPAPASRKSIKIEFLKLGTCRFLQDHVTSFRHRFCSIRYPSVSFYAQTPPDDCGMGFGCHQKKFAVSCVDATCRTHVRLHFQGLTMYTRAELQVLVHNFETKTLPKEAWTHEAHLAVGLWYAVTAPENMLARLRQNIRTYNAAVGGQNTETAGYHETITDFYVRLLIGYARKHALTEVSPQVLSDFLATPYAGRNYPLTFWTKDVLFSPTVRKAWHDPDIQPLPDWFA